MAGFGCQLDAAASNWTPLPCPCSLMERAEAHWIRRLQISEVGVTRMAPNEELNTPSELLEESQRQAYYCRGCSGPLPQGRSARFHAECLQADKRRVIAERRQRETQQLHAWLRRHRCPDCGTTLEKLAHVNPRRSVEMACETSQSSSETADSQEGLNGREIAVELAEPP